MGTTTILGVLVAFAAAIGAAFKFGDRLLGWIAEWRARRTGRIEKENKDLRSRDADNTKAARIDAEIGRLGPEELHKRRAKWDRDKPPPPP